MNLDFIYRRRSVRKFQPDYTLSDKDINELLTAAMSAPSACAKDPWRFLVIRNRELLHKIAAALPNGKFLPEAGTGIIVCGDLTRAHSGELSYLLQDCSAAIENLLLAATAKDIGACWLGVHPRPDRIAMLSKEFSLPETIIPVAIIALGQAIETPEPRQRFVSEYATFLD